MSKILIIDDEVQIRGLLARMMELEGYEVWKRGGSGDGDEEKISGSRDYSADGTWKHT